MIATWGQAGGGVNAGLSFWLPLTDAGAGAVNLAPVSSAGSPTAAFTRATTAWTKLASGLWASVASGAARSCYLGADTAVGAYGGYLSESARTNECLQARDFSNASWTKSSVTAAKDQAGIDGVANSASSLVATGANGTVKQAIVSASAARRFSVFMKRITGTGNIDLTLDNGTTWTTVSGSINSTTFTRVAIGQTVANPTVGIRIVTSGDKVAVDMAQEEVGAFDTSPIPTTTGSTTRNADVLSYASARNLVALSPYTIYAEAVIEGVLGNNQNVIGSDVSYNAYLVLQTSVPRAAFGNGDGANLATEAYSTANMMTVTKYVGRFDGSNVDVFVNGTKGTTVAKGTQVSEITKVYIGGHNGLQQLQGPIKNVRMWARSLSDSEAAAL